MAKLLTPDEKTALTTEASLLVSGADLTERERIVIEMLSGASQGYRYNIAEICAILRSDQPSIEAHHKLAAQKLGVRAIARLAEINNLLTADFPERE